MAFVVSPESEQVMDKGWLAECTECPAYVDDDGCTYHLTKPFSGENAKIAAQNWSIEHFQEIGHRARVLAYEANDDGAVFIASEQP